MGAASKNLASYFTHDNNIDGYQARLDQYGINGNEDSDMTLIQIYTKKVELTKI